jgi:hypothetical protein
VVGRLEQVTPVEPVERLEQIDAGRWERSTWTLEVLLDSAMK